MDSKKIEIISSYFKKNKNFSAYIRIFGCQQNEADAQVLRNFLIKFKMEIIDNINEAGIIIFNTCAVRHSAENRVFGHIGELKKIKQKNPKVFIIICGCMTEQNHVKQNILENYPYVNLVFGTDYYNFDKILYEKILKIYGNTNFKLNENEFYVKDKLENEIIDNKARKSRFKAYVPIISGCNNFCSYCIVPLVRGREKSREPTIILKEINGLVKDGYKDITLLGQNVNSYGKDLITKYNFSYLLNEINKIEGDYIFRFMTSHPKDFTDDLCDSIKRNKKFCGHIHLPFQSGSNKILKLMNRGYTREKYLQIIKNIKEKLPEIYLTSDVIVGFPGESDEDFELTLSLIKEVEFISLFTFVYSVRKNTVAEKLENNISSTQKASRMKILIDIQRKITRKIIEKRMINKKIRVIIDEINENFFVTRAYNNQVIFVDKDYNFKIGDFIFVKPAYIEHGTLFAKIFN